MYGQAILWWISKVFKQNILPIHWKLQFLYRIKILRAISFWNAPPGLSQSAFPDTIEFDPWLMMSYHGHERVM